MKKAINSLAIASFLVLFLVPCPESFAPNNGISFSYTAFIVACAFGFFLARAQDVFFLECFPLSF